MNFEELKQEILDRAKKAGACRGQYQRAEEAKTIEELIEVLKDNISFARSNDVLTIELSKQYERPELFNIGKDNAGFFNSGYRNSGDRNSGYRNSGDRNSGDRNSGYRNSGDLNSGDRNSGDLNSGYRNSGDRNRELTGEKKCYKCNDPKPVAEFYIRIDSRTGFRYLTNCKECERIRRSDYNQRKRQAKYEEVSR